MTDAERGNLTRWRPEDAGGHVESYFLKANSPDRRRAVWIKHTLFAPGGRPAAAVAEVWAVVFDRETHRHVALKHTTPAHGAEIARERFRLVFGDCTLEPGRAQGKLTGSAPGETIAWDLRFTTASEPSWPLPARALYDLPVPRFKIVTPYTDERFEGTLTVGDERLAVDGWPGMQGHNWGREHTWRYAWVHCNAFEGAPPGTWFEGASARVKLGPVATPWLSYAHLRHDGRLYAFNDVRTLVRARSDLRWYRWSFALSEESHTLEGWFEAPREDVVGLFYPNPYGSTTHCLNSKLASGEVVLRHAGPRGAEIARLHTTGGAALEIATTQTDHGARMYV